MTAGHLLHSGGEGGIGEERQKLLEGDLCLILSQTGREFDIDQHTALAQTRETTHGRKERGMIRHRVGL